MEEASGGRKRDLDREDVVCQSRYNVVVNLFSTKLR